MLRTAAPAKLALASGRLRRRKQRCQYVQWVPAHFDHSPLAPLADTSPKLELHGCGVKAPDRICAPATAAPPAVCDFLYKSKIAAAAAGALNEPARNSAAAAGTAAPRANPPGVRIERIGDPGDVEHLRDCANVGGGFGRMAPSPPRRQESATAATTSRSGGSRRRFLPPRRRRRHPVRSRRQHSRSLAGAQHRLDRRCARFARQRHLPEERLLPAAAALLRAGSLRAPAAAAAILLYVTEVANRGRRRGCRGAYAIRSLDRIAPG